MCTAEDTRARLDAAQAFKATGNEHFKAASSSKDGAQLEKALEAYIKAIGTFRYFVRNNDKEELPLLDDTDQILDDDMRAEAKDVIASSLLNAAACLARQGQDRREHAAGIVYATTECLALDDRRAVMRAVHVDAALEQVGRRIGRVDLSAERQRLRLWYHLQILRHEEL